MECEKYRKQRERINNLTLVMNGPKFNISKEDVIGYSDYLVTTPGKTITCYVNDALYLSESERRAWSELGLSHYAVPCEYINKMVSDLMNEIKNCGKRSRSRGKTSIRKGKVNNL